MKHNEDTFHARDGLTLFEQSWLPDGEARAVVAIVHGYAEHSGRYQHVGEALAARGYAVETLDLRGHGRSEGERATVRSFGQFLSDLRLFLTRVAARYTNTPLFVLGHSMGGTIVTLYAVVDRPAVQGLVLSGPGLVGRGRGWRVTGSVFAVVGRLFPRLPLAQLEARTVSRDPAVVAAYDSDPFVYRGRMRAGMLRAFHFALDRIQRDMEAVTAPLLIMHGTADELTDPEGRRQLHERALSSDKTLKLYEGLAHEVLNEPEQEEVIGDLLAWLDAHTTSQRSANALQSGETAAGPNAEPVARRGSV
jgi:alpha-beta hydrolase superfamily lysophospholipase